MSASRSGGVGPLRFLPGLVCGHSGRFLPESQDRFQACRSSISTAALKLGSLPACRRGASTWRMRTIALLLFEPVSPSRAVWTHAPSRTVWSASIKCSEDGIGSLGRSDPERGRRRNDISQRLDRRRGSIKGYVAQFRRTGPSSDQYDPGLETAKICPSRRPGPSGFRLRYGATARREAQDTAERTGGETVAGPAAGG